jgi:hypothetical protein
MIKLITTTAAIIAVSIPNNAIAAPNQPVRSIQQNDKATMANLDQAVDQWIADIRLALAAFRNVNKDDQERALALDNLIAKLKSAAYKCRKGGKLDDEVVQAISLCLKRAEFASQYAQKSGLSQDRVDRYLALANIFKGQAGQIDEIRNEIISMQTAFGDYQVDLTEDRQLFIVEIAANETKEAQARLDRVAGDMKKVMGMLGDLKAKPAEIVAIRYGNKVAVNTK